MPSQPDATQTKPSQLVISALGDDRPGIVDELSNTVYSQQLNIEDSRMTVLGGEFAILLLVSGSDTDIEKFCAQKALLEESLQMQILLKQTTPTEPDDSIIPCQVDVAAMDHPGIVQNLASFFSDKQINIMNLDTDKYAAPHTGTPMFSLHMTIGIPADIAIAQLRDDFSLFCDERNLDAELKIL